MLREEFAAVRAGRANPHILDKIQAEAYGGMSPLNQLGNISALDARCLVVSPWDKSLLKSIEKAILSANIGLTPTNDGNVIRLVFPELTEERRKMKNNKELSEDESKSCEQDVEKKIASCIEEIDKAVAAKEKELLTV